MELSRANTKKEPCVIANTNASPQFRTSNALHALSFRYPLRYELNPKNPPMTRHSARHSSKYRVRPICATAPKPAAGRSMYEDWL